MMRPYFHSILIFLILPINFIQSQHGMTYGIQSQVFVVLDSTNRNGGTMGSYSQFKLNYSNTYQFLNMKINAVGRGTYLHNNVNNKAKFRPEWDISSIINPIDPLGIKLFSNQKTYIPNHFINSASHNIESESGIEIDYQFLQSSHFVFKSGIRSIDHYNRLIRNSFKSIGFLKRNGVSNLNVHSDFTRSNKENFYRHGLNYWHQLGKGRLSFVANHNNFNDFQYSNLLLHGHLPFGQRHRLKMKLFYNDYQHDSVNQFHQTNLIQYIFHPTKMIFIETRIEGQWIRENYQSLSNWRTVLSGIGLRLNKNNFRLNSGTYVGYREDMTFGKGLNIVSENEVIYQTIPSPLIQIQIKDIFNAVYLNGASVSNTVKFYELDNHSHFEFSFFPYKKLQPGYKLIVDTHFGSELTFQPDSLQNLMINTLFIKYRQRSNYIEVGFSITDHFKSKLKPINIYSINYQVKFPFNIRLNGLIRYSTRDLLNLRTSINYYWLNNQLQVDLDHFGMPNQFLKDQTHFTVRFKRGI